MATILHDFDDGNKDYNYILVSYCPKSDRQVNKIFGDFENFKRFRNIPGFYLDDIGVWRIKQLHNWI